MVEACTIVGRKRVDVFQADPPNPAKFSIFAEDSSVTSHYINERVEATSFGIDKPLEKGTYRWQVEAYNGADKKLAESGDDIKFTIN